jgi:hypothetical protein
MCREYLKRQPDGDTIKRLETLFYPRFVFNWEYEGPIHEQDPQLGGPTGVTIAELYLQRKTAG